MTADDDPDAELWLAAHGKLKWEAAVRREQDQETRQLFAHT